MRAHYYARGPIRYLVPLELTQRERNICDVSVTIIWTFGSQGHMGRFIA